MNFTEFLLKQQPICTTSPLRSKLQPNVFYKLKAKAIKEYGFDMLGDQCLRLRGCFSESGCIGRPFPDYPEIRAALGHLNLSTDTYRGKTVLVVKAHVKCATCPFKAQCTETCGTINNYIERFNKPQDEPFESNMVPLDWVGTSHLEALSFESFKQTDGDKQEKDTITSWTSDDLAWDCLSGQQRQAVEMRYYDGMEQDEIAQKMNIAQQTVHDHIESGIKRLRKFTQARLAIKSDSSTPWWIKAYFIDGKNEEEIAKKLGKHRSSVNREISKWILSKSIK